MIAWLEATTWAGLSLDAEHWFGDLRCGDGKVRLSHAMSAAEAQHNNKKLGKAIYKPGELTEGFSSYEALADHAKQVFQHHFPDARLLVGGRDSLYPKLVLFGPPDVQQQARVLVDRMEANYGGRHEPQSWDEYDAILDEWKALIAPYKGQ